MNLFDINRRTAILATLLVSWLSLGVIHTGLAGGGEWDGGDCNCGEPSYGKQNSGGLGCNCDCEPKAKKQARRDTGIWVPTEPTTPQPIDQVDEPTPAPPADPFVITTVKVERNKWPKIYVEATEGASMEATWDCNGWRQNTNPKVYPGDLINICGF